MDDAGVRLLTPDALRALMAKWDEEKYLLVDVRQPSEYTQGHIPGATLLPLTELQAKVFDLPSDRELVFYCHAGGRSSFAADLAAEAEVTERGVYNLAGGILAWDGRMLPDYPRVQVFDKQKSPAELLMTAMNLEKGAFRFYTHVVEKFGDAPFVKTMSDLSRAEEGHARTIHRFWERIGNGKEPFEALFDRLDGEILEGGGDLKQMMARVDQMDQRDQRDQTRQNPCMTLMELALSIEYAAYDLYRTMAIQNEDSAARDAFWRIAQAEKAHMRMITRAIPECEKG